MTARGTSLLLATLAILSADATTARADDHALAAALRGAVESNIAGYESKDVDATLKTIHSKSPAYDTTKEALARQADLDVDFELVDFRYIGHDDEFALARVKIRTTPAAGESDVAGNTVDAILIFHQENGVWKIWGEQLLGAELAGQ
jgi:hypothetical protein